MRFWMNLRDLKDIMSKLDFLKNLGLEKQNSGVSTGTEWLTGNGSLIESVSPADGSVIAHVRNANREDYETVISQAQESFPEGFHGHFIDHGAD